MFRSATRQLIFPQSEHGRMAGALAHIWGNAQFDRPDFDFVRFVDGVGLHDIGFGYFDEFGIGDMDDATRVHTLNLLIDRRLSDPVTETVKLFHVLRLIGESDARRSLREKCEGRISEGIDASGVSRERFLWADRVTDLCDAIAFDFCFDKPLDGTTAVLPRLRSPDTVDVRYTITAERNISVEPWPFAIQEFDSYILAYRADGYPQTLDPRPVHFRLSPRSN